MASACTKSIQNSPNTHPPSEPTDKCSNTSISSTSLVDVSSSPNKSQPTNYTKTYRAVGPRSPNKRHITSTILMPPPGTYPRIPPFPGIGNSSSIPPSNIYFPGMSSLPMLPPSTPSFPPQDLMMSAPSPSPMFQSNMVFHPISESNGYRLMMIVPVGHRDDGTYGMLNWGGVRPDQEYRVSCYYANNVTYYQLPSDFPLVSGPSPNIL